VLATREPSTEDICVGFAAYLATRIGARDELGEATLAWLKRCMARPAFQRAQARH